MSEVDPRQVDAVLGGQTPPPVAGAILGGLAGAKQRLKSETLAARRLALTEALQYGEQGIELAIQALQDPAEEIHLFAGRLLRTQGGERGKQALFEHQPLSYFTTLENWRFETYRSQVGIVDPENNACVVRMTNNGSSVNGQPPSRRYDLSQFKTLLQDPRVEEVQALVFQIDYNYWNETHTFGVALDALLAAKATFPNLKALFIGDSEGDRAPEFGKSKLRIFDISPILKAFPRLEALHVFGFFGDASGYTLECEGLRHDALKSLTIETSDITGANINQLCSMNLPNLEWFELWFGRSHEYNSKVPVSALTPILWGDTYPKLKYLGLCSSENLGTLLPAVLNAPIIERLVVLDLMMGTLRDNLAEVFKEMPDTANLKILDVTGNQLSDEAVSRLASYAAQVVSDYQFGTNDYDYYNEEGESDPERRMNRHHALYE